MKYHELHFNEIDSTNNYLKNTHQLLDEFTFVSADYQSHGKGRNERIWLSKEGENLMFSFLLKSEQYMQIAPIISILSAVEVAKTLQEYKIKNVSIKWPNDVNIGDKKVCGILLEAQLPDYLVIGIGINVNQNEFPDGLRRPATSMSLELKRVIDIDGLKHKLFSNIVNSFLNIDKANALNYFKEHNYLLNKMVRVSINNQIFIGEVVDIDDKFQLQIKCRDMLLHLDSGEIEIIS